MGLIHSNDLPTLGVVYGIAFILFIICLWNESQVKKWRRNKK